MPFENIAWHHPTSSRLPPIDAALEKAEQWLDTTGKIHLYRAEKYLKYVAAREKEQMAIKEQKYFEALHVNTTETPPELPAISFADIGRPRLELNTDQQDLSVKAVDLGFQVGTLPNHPLSNVRGGSSYPTPDLSLSPEPSNHLTKVRENSRLSPSGPQGSQFSDNNSSDSAKFSTSGEGNHSGLTCKDITCDSVKDDVWRSFENLLLQVKVVIDDVKYSLPDSAINSEMEENELLNIQESIQWVVQSIFSDRRIAHERDMCVECCPFENCNDCRYQAGKLCIECCQTEDCKDCDQYATDICPKCCQDTTCKDCWRMGGQNGENRDLAAGSILSGDSCFQSPNVSPLVRHPSKFYTPSILKGINGHETEEEGDVALSVQDGNKDHSQERTEVMGKRSSLIPKPMPCPFNCGYIGEDSQFMLTHISSAHPRSSYLDCGASTKNSEILCCRKEAARMAKNGATNSQRSRRSFMAEDASCPFNCGYSSTGGWEYTIRHIYLRHAEGSYFQYNTSEQVAEFITKHRNAHSLTDSCEFVNGPKKGSSIVEESKGECSITGLPRLAKKRAKRLQMVDPANQSARSAGDSDNQHATCSDTNTTLPSNFGSPETSTSDEKGFARTPLISPPSFEGLTSSRKRSLGMDMEKASVSMPKKRVRFVEPLGGDS